MVGFDDGAIATSVTHSSLITLHYFQGRSENGEITVGTDDGAISTSVTHSTLITLHYFQGQNLDETILMSTHNIGYDIHLLIF